MSASTTHTDHVEIFTTTGLSGEFRQAEIFSDVVQYIYDSQTENVDAITRPFTILAAQDCDLLWDFESRAAGSVGSLANALMFEAKTFSATRHTIKGSDLWRRIWQNQDERYHFIEASPQHTDLTTEGLPALIVDFKSVFSVPVSDLYNQIKSGTSKRRCRLNVSYREHFQTRAAFFMQRVMLPRQHHAPEISAK